VGVLTSEGAGAGVGAAAVEDGLAFRDVPAARILAVALPAVRGSACGCSDGSTDAVGSGVADADGCTTATADGTVGAFGVSRWRCCVRVNTKKGSAIATKRTVAPME
jgi:hypothetical protein